ncbi:MAG: glycoside hydrolase family 104 protein [Pseudanabaenaceae cyanobacterium]
MRKTVAILLTAAVVTGAHLGESASAQDCFMVTSTGQYINLNHLCRSGLPSNPPAVRPKPKPKPASPGSDPYLETREYPTYPASVNLQAFLRVIRYAEGTDSEDGYQIEFTGTRFYNFADHPRRVRCSGRLCSSAAGAYQFLETTWDDVARRIGAPDFSPEWQDLAAIELIRREGALEDVEAGRIERAIAKTANVWASFPRWYGDYHGYYGQSVVPMEYLVSEFRRQQSIIASGGGGTPRRPAVVRLYRGSPQ